MTKRIYLIDSPGVVYDEGDTPEDIVLKGVVRAEKLEDAEQYIGPMLSKVDAEVIKKAYDIEQWEDAEDFLDKLAHKTGRLKRGGDANLN